MLCGDARAVNQSPVVRLEKLAVVFHRNVQHAPVNRDASVIDPRIEAAEMLNGSVRNPPDILFLPDICNDRDGLAAISFNFILKLAERVTASRREHKLCALLRCHSCRYQTDAARSTRNHNDLLIEL